MGYRVFFAFLSLFAVLHPLHCSQLKNVTSAVFGKEINILPLAFGDFNSDKLTDLIVMDSEHAKISVLLAEPQTFTIAAEKYFDLASEARKKDLVCFTGGYDIVSATPGDFDGDGGMDILLLIQNQKEPLMAYVLWGDHNHRTKEHKLLCPASWIGGIEMDSEPLVIDGNGDSIADLYGTSNNSQGVWIFGRDRSKGPIFVTLEENAEERFRRPHSNAFLDLDSDGNADLFVTGERRFELWQNVGEKAISHFERHNSIKYPNKHIGQSVFADFDLDGKLDMVFPACDDDKCETSTMYIVTVEQLWSANEEGFIWSNQEMPLNLGQWQFDTLDDGNEKNPYQGLAPHVGDINLDGYPDLLIRMRHKVTKQAQMHLLLNIEFASSPSPHSRGFLLQPEIMQDLNDTVVAAFYDLYENGQEDILLVQKRGEGLEIGIYTNVTQGSDAYFVKVIVLSGICYKDCPGDHIEVPYGTNLPGQSICYRTQRPSAEETSVEIQSCAPQLSQTAHHALQLPYTIFGLGLSPNFLDFMYVNVTNATSLSRGKAWTQIIPNSQMYVIPHPPEAPSRWEAKLFITPSRGITLTGLALVGTCVLCVLIILFFHWRERRQDKREKMQQPNQFHFDAM